MFLFILTRFPFFQKRFGCNFKGIRQLQLVLLHAHIFSRYYSLPVSPGLKTSTCAAHHVTSVDRWKNSRVAIFPLEAQTIHCNHLECRAFILLFVFP